MSRITFRSTLVPSYEITFGLDCPNTALAGYFLDIWSDGEEWPYIELDTRPGFVPNPVSRGDILDTLKQHGCPEEYIHRIAMDLDPAG